jgi:hypothetical protein
MATEDPLRHFARIARALVGVQIILQAAPASAASLEHQRALEDRIRYLEGRLLRLEARFPFAPSKPSVPSSPSRSTTARQSAPPRILQQTITTVDAPAASEPPPRVAPAVDASRPGAGQPGDAAQETFVFRENAVTLKPVKMELSTQFAYIRGNGFLQTDRAFVSTSAFRVGVFDWLELGATVPAYEATRSRSIGPFASRAETASGLGDIGLQANIRLRDQTAATPGAVVSLGGILPTGVSPYRFTFYQPDRGRPLYNPSPVNLNGNYLSRGIAGVTSNLQFYKTLDPVIVFFGAGIQYFLPDRIGGHEVQPGLSYSYNFGLSFALSEKSTLGLQVNGAYATKLLVDRRQVPVSQLEPIAVRVSLIQRVFANTYLEPELTAGLTNNAPNAALALGLRHRF